MRISLPILAALALLAMSGIALADDWTAVRLRGQMLELVGKQWQPIGRGAVVADGTAVRSLGNGYADFVRGTETLSIGPNTQIKIADQAVAGSKPFTTVTEYFGTVEIDADVENVKHFAVETPYLAAVVKGTRFVVTSGPGGASVTVDRGHVAVSDFADHTHVTVTVGQTATVTAHHRSRKDGLTVSGAGDLPPVLDDPATKSSASTTTTTTSSTSDEAASDDTSTGSDKGKGDDEFGDGKSGKTDNGNGNGGMPGNGKGKQAALSLSADWLSAFA